MASTTRRRRRSSYDLTPTWLTRGRIVLACAVLVVGLIGGYGARVVLSLAHLFGESPISVITDIIHRGSGDAGSVANKFANGQRVNIALYGYGGGSHDGAFLTDSIMVVSIQPRGDGKAPQIAEVSIPRDWFVPIPVGGSQKTYDARVNEAYQIGQVGQPISSAAYSGAHGGGQLADATIASMLGITIDHFVGLDFTAFKSAVDSVGGVDITVEHTFTDNNYPHGECDDPVHPDCAVETIHFDAGRQHMDGATALIFARSRESSDPQEGTNFARNKRQQLVLTAIKQKVLSVGGLRNLPDLLNSLGDHVKTDLPLSDALALYDLVKNVDARSIEHVSIDDTNFIYECGPPYGTWSCPAAYEYPYDRSFATVHHFIQNIFPPVSTIAEHAPVSVQDGSGRNQGASKRWATLLTDTGLAATDGGAVRPSATTHVIDSSGGRYSGTATWLAKYYGVQVETAPAPASGSAAPATAKAAAPAGGITLVLGQDEERSFYGTSGGAYASATGAAGGSGYGTGYSTGATPGAPRRSTAPPATARPAPPPAATPASTPKPTPGGLLYPPPLSTSTSAPTPASSPSSGASPTPKTKPRPTPRPSPASSP